jgi:hypothetical protein
MELVIKQGIAVLTKRAHPLSTTGVNNSSCQKKSFPQRLGETCATGTGARHYVTARISQVYFS